MKNWIFVATVLSLFICMGTASANQAGAISQEALSQMGLDGLQPMPDQEGLEVRGRGFASVFGFGFPAWPPITADFTFRPNRVVSITIRDLTPGVRVSVTAWAVTH